MSGAGKIYDYRYGGNAQKGGIDDKSIERYSVIRALGAVRRADVAVVMIDATEGITEQDVKVAGYVDSEGKPCVIAVNKWDAVEKDTYTIEEYNKKISADLAFMPYARVFIFRRRQDCVLTDCLRCCIPRMKIISGASRREC